jgi:hypothetical protein
VNHTINTRIFDEHCFCTEYIRRKKKKILNMDSHKKKRDSDQISIMTIYVVLENLNITHDRKVWDL